MNTKHQSNHMFPSIHSQPTQLLLSSSQTDIDELQ
jgi:hypothetical protein